MNTKRIRRTNTLAAGLGLIGLIATSFGCYKVQYRNPSASIGDKHEIKQNLFLWGGFGGSEVNLESLCPQGVAQLGSKHSGLDVVLYTLTGGLYSPVSVEVHCKGGSAFQLDRTDDGVTVHAAREPTP